MFEKGAIKNKATIDNYGKITNNGTIENIEEGKLAIGATGNVVFESSGKIVGVAGLQFAKGHASTQSLAWRAAGMAASTEGGATEDFDYKKEYEAAGLTLSGSATAGYTITGSESDLNAYMTKENSNCEKLFAGGNRENGLLCAGVDVISPVQGAKKVTPYRATLTGEAKTLTARGQANLSDPSNGETWVYGGVHQQYPVVAGISTEGTLEVTDLNNVTYYYAFAWQDDQDNVVGISYATLTNNITALSDN